MLNRDTHLTDEQMNELCHVDVCRFADFVAVLENEYLNKGDGSGMTFYEYVEEMSSHMATEEDFKDYTINEFNDSFSVNLDENENDLEKITDLLEESDFGCFYISYDVNDVLKAIEEEELEAIKIGLEHICLDDRIYMSVYGGCYA